MPLAAQFQAPLEAESPEEFDLYLTVEGAPDAVAVVKRSEAFRERWPKSNLLPRVWEMRFLALQRLGKTDEAKAAGEEALRLAPGNLTVRAGLAVQLASIPEDIRGYGHVKDRHLAAAKQKEASLLAAFRAPAAQASAAE